MIHIKRNNLDKLALEHLNNLKSIIKGRLKKYGGNVFRFIDNNLDIILSGRPDVLQKEIINKIPKLRRKDNDKIKSIFNYDSFVGSKKYGAYHLAENLNVCVCPYCNRQYTFTLNLQNGKTRPEFDHFFCKSKYPYLALSFYNLIPSCHICNSNLKGKKEFDLIKYIHPYLEGFDDSVKFHIWLLGKNVTDPNIFNNLGLNFFYGTFSDFEIKLKIASPLADIHSKANGNIEVFKLEELYNEHKDYVIELIQKAIIYTNEYINELINQYPAIFRNRDDIKRMILSNYLSMNDLDKRPLAKLTKDIAEELNLFQTNY